jgi:hypothetical protein
VAGAVGAGDGDLGGDDPRDQPVDARQVGAVVPGAARLTRQLTLWLPVASRRVRSLLSSALSASASPLWAAASCARSSAGGRGGCSGCTWEPARAGGERGIVFPGSVAINLLLLVGGGLATAAGVVLLTAHDASGGQRAGGVLLAVLAALAAALGAARLRGGGWRVYLRPSGVTPGDRDRGDLPVVGRDWRCLRAGGHDVRPRDGDARAVHRVPGERPGGDQDEAAHPRHAPP